jgi:hypothetical protein
MCLFSMCCIYVSDNSADVGAPMVSPSFVYSIAGQFGSTGLLIQGVLSSIPSQIRAEFQLTDET